MATLPKDAQDLFDNLVPEGLKQFPDKARELNAVYCFKISGDASGQGGEWTVDCTSNPPSCTKGDSGKAQCTVEVSSEDFKTVLSDNDDWATVSFAGLSDNDGAPVHRPEVIVEQPVPATAR